MREATMWLMLAEESAMAAGPPVSEYGRIRTGGGVFAHPGPTVGLWGDLAADLGSHLALRGSLETPTSLDRVTASALGELWAGPWRLRLFAAGGPTATLSLHADPALGWRVEAGARVVVRWGFGFVAAGGYADGPNARLGAWTEW
jgi:hypothetical protein